MTQSVGPLRFPVIGCYRAGTSLLPKNFAKAALAPGCYNALILAAVAVALAVAAFFL